MWKALHQLAIPERLYRLCGCWIPAGGVERAVAGHRPVGLWLRPADYQQGKATGSCTFTFRRRCGRWAVRRWPSRPSSGWSGRSKWPTAIAARRRWGGLHRWRWSAARHGASRCGDWWIWDARLTSELVLLFLYAGVIALWHAFDDRRLAGARRGSSCWSGWSICPSFITRSTGGTPCTGLDQPAANHRPKHASAAADLHLCLPHAVGHPDPDAPA